MSLIFTVAFSAVMIVCGVKQSKNGSVAQSDEKIYIELWHIDTFEGGTGSRAAFLSAVSKQYEKNNKVCVTVKTQTALSAAEFFAKGVFPDLLSYGNGVALPYEMLVKIYSRKPYEYAVPWCMGGYVRIVRKGVNATKTILSVQDNALSLVAAGFEEIDCADITEVSSNLAIYEFYKNKDVALIGTQRDLYRLENKGIDIEVAPLTVFNDLYQYVSVLSVSDERAKAANAFVGYLLSDGAQKKLSRIGMRSFFFTTDDGAVSVLDGVNYKLVTPPLIKKDELGRLKNLSTDFGKNREIIRSSLYKTKK